jgi:hypothetical protein
VPAIAPAIDDSLPVGVYFRCTERPGTTLKKRSRCLVFGSASPNLSAQTRTPNPTNVAMGLPSETR